MSFPLDPTLWNSRAGPSSVTNQTEASEDSFSDDQIDAESGTSEGSVYQQSDGGESGGENEEVQARRADPSNAGLTKLINSVFHGQAREALLDPNAPAGALGESWDKSIKDVMEDLENDPVRRSRRKRGRRSAAVALSPEVKSLLAQANVHFVQQDYKAAIDVLQEVIRIEPNTKAAYHTLSAIHTDLGSHEKALQLDIIAAHIPPREASVWKDLGAQSRQAGLLQQAIYCYSQAIDLGRSDVDALWDRAILFAETGQTTQAILSFDALLRLNPHDPATVREMVPILITSEDIPGAAKRLQAAFEYHVERSPQGPSEFTVELQDIVDLVDLLKSQRRYFEAISTIKRGQRWLQGRYTSDAVWDQFTDDREYDEKRKARPDWQRNEQLRWIEDTPTYELDPRLRAGLAISRLMTNDSFEADLHLLVIRNLDVLDHFSLYGEVADAYLEKKIYPTALELYQTLANCEATNSWPVWAKIAECNRHLGNLEGAVECYEAVLEEQPDNMDIRLQLAEVYEDLGNRDKALTLVNQVLAARRSTQQTASQSTPAEDLPTIDIEANSFFTENVSAKPINKTKRKEINREMRQQAEAQRQADFELAYQKLSFLDHGLIAGDPEATREWLDVASYLIDGFRETPALFPRDGKTKYHGIVSRKQKKRKAAGEQDAMDHANELASRLERQISDDETEARVKRKDVVSKTFCNIDFDDWLVLSIRYAFVLTVNGEAEEADTVLRHLCTAANFRQSPEKLQSLLLAIVACLLHTGDYDAASSEFRRVILRYNHLQTESARVLSSLFAIGQPASIAYSDAKLQKFNLRSIKQIDSNALFPHQASSSKGRRASRGDEDMASDEEEVEQDGKFKPTKVNPTLLAFYAHSLAMSKSFQSALCLLFFSSFFAMSDKGSDYYIRAYEAAPHDPLICLATGIAYIHRAMQRQTDNRHHQIAQGFTFLAQYRNLRGSCQEVEYNFGRAFHMLGLYGLALKHYQKVLQMESEFEHIADTPERDTSLARIDFCLPPPLFATKQADNMIAWLEPQMPFYFPGNYVKGFVLIEDQSAATRALRVQLKCKVRADGVGQLGGAISQRNVLFDNTLRLRRHKIIDGPEASESLEVPFSFQIPLDAAPTHSFSKDNLYKIQLFYHLDIFCRQSKFGKPTRLRRIPIQVALRDPLDGALLPLVPTWIPAPIATLEHEIRHKPWQGKEHVRVELSLPALSHLPCGTTMPFKIMIQSWSQKHKTKTRRLPKWADSVPGIDMKVKSETCFGAKGVISSRNSRYEEWKAVVCAPPQEVVEPLEWEPVLDESQPGQGRWTQRFVYDGHLRIDSSPDFRSAMVAVRHAIRVRVRFHSLASMSLDKKIVVSSGLTDNNISTVPWTADTNVLGTRYNLNALQPLIMRADPDQDLMPYPGLKE